MNQEMNKHINCIDKQKVVSVLKYIEQEIWEINGQENMGTHIIPFAKKELGLED